METLTVEIFDFFLKCFIYVFCVGGFICFLFFLDRGMRRLLTMDLGGPVIKIHYKKK